jgi:hypothetical protein
MHEAHGISDIGNSHSARGAVAVNERSRFIISALKNAVR